MNDLLTQSRTIAAVKFKWQKDEKTYDYFIPHGLEISVGQKVMVETKRGETEVEVMAIKAESEMAEKAIIRIAEPKADELTAKTTEDWNF